MKVVALILLVVGLFNVIVLVHELGHFLAARWCGLVVERVGLWFGPSWFRRKVFGVELRMGSLPFGGYVVVPQMQNAAVLEGQSRYQGLLPAQPGQRALVALAGPVFSFALAAVLAVFVRWAGVPVSESEFNLRIGYVEKGGAAQVAGLRSGDIIRGINGVVPLRFTGLKDSVFWIVASSAEPVVSVAVERDGARRTFSVKPDLRLFSDTRPPIRDLGVEPAKACVVGRLFPNGPALLAGLRENDEIVMLNGEVLWHPHMFAERVRESEGPVVVTYRRGRAMHTVSVVPIQPQGAERKMLGVQWDSMGRISIDHPSVWSQLAGSASLMFDTLHTLMTSKDIKVEHLSGPVGVFRIYYVLLDSPYGWRLVLWFSVLLNVNLAIFNLLPVPVLDGGHILLALLSYLFHGVERSLWVVKLQAGVATLLLMGILYLTFFDVLDLGRSFFGKTVVPIDTFEFRPGK